MQREGARSKSKWLISKMVPSRLKSALRAWAIEYVAAQKEHTLPTPSAAVTARVNAGQGFDMHVVPGDIISDYILQFGLWEGTLTQAILKEADAGGLLVEVGANLGYFSLLWAAQSLPNRALAFEPSPRNAALMWENIALNGLNDRISLFPVAAGSRLAISPFELGPQEQTGWGGVINDTRDVIALSYVLEVPLDEILSTVGDIAVLKVDVEGYDTRVLEGCRRLFETRRVKRVFYEQNIPRMLAIGIEPDRARTFMESVGYEVSILDDASPEVTEWTAVPRAS